MFLIIFLNISVMCFIVNFFLLVIIMMYTYFVLYNEDLKYPIYVCFDCVMSITAFRNNRAAWSLIYNLTNFRKTLFHIEYCSYETFSRGIIKIDFSC